MVNAGFNPLEEIARKTGKSIGELKNEMSKGAISSKMVQDAFISATSAGGKFYGMSAEGAKTLNGQISMLQESFDNMFNEIGSKGEGVIMKAVQAGTYLVENYEAIGKGIEGLIIAYGIYRTGLALNMVLEKAMAANMTITGYVIDALKAKWAELNATALLNPYVAAAAALAAFGMALYEVSKQADTASAANNRLQDANNNVSKTAESEISKLNDLRAELEQSEKGTKSWKDAKDAIISQYGQYDSRLAAEIDRTGTLTSSYNRLTEAIRKSVAARQLKQFYDSNMQATQDAIQKLRATLYKGLVDVYGQRYANGLMKYVNEYVSTGKGLDKEVVYKGKKTTVRNLTNNIHGALFSLGGGFEIKQMRELQVNGDKAVNDFADMNGISKKTRNEIIYGITPTSQKKEQANAKNYQQEVKKTRSAWQKAHKEVLRLKKAKGATVKQIQDAQAKEKAASDAYKKLTDTTPEQEYKVSPSKTNSRPHKIPKQDNTDDDALRAAEAAEKAFEIETKAKLENRRKAEDLANETEQAEIDILKDGNEKKLRQIELNRKKEQEAIDRAFEDIKQQRIEQAKQKWEANPKNKDKNFYNTSEYAYASSNDRYTDAEYKNYDTKTKAAWHKYDEEIAKLKDAEIAYEDSLIKANESYFDKKKDLVQKYSKDVIEINKAISEAGKRGDGDRVNALYRTLTEARANYGKEQMALAFEQLKKDPNYVAAFDDLKGASTDTLNSLIGRFSDVKQAAGEALNPEEVKTYFDAINGMIDELISRDPIGMIKKLTDELIKQQDELKASENRRDRVKGGEKIIKSIGYNKDLKKWVSEYWELADAEADVAAKGQQVAQTTHKIENAHKTLTKSIQGVADKMDELGGKIGGQTGEIFSLFGSVMTYYQTISDGVTAIGKAGSNAMKAIESASVILAIISAAIQLMQTLSSVLPNQDDLYEKAARKQAEINKLRDSVNDYRLAVMKARHEESNWFSDSGLKGLQDAYEEHGQVAESYYKKLNEAQEKYIDKSSGLKKALVPIVAGVTAIGAVALGVLTAGTGAVALGSLGSAVIGALSTSAVTATVATATGAAVAGLAGAIVGKAIDSAVGSITYKNGQVAAKDNLRIQTRHKSFWRGQKTADLKDWVKEKYGKDLFGKDGMIDKELANEVLKNYGHKLQGETKETLEKLVELREKYDEFNKSIHEYVSKLYSPLVNDMTESIWTWLKDGKDALSEFKDAASKTFSNVAKDMLKQLLMKNVFKQYEEQLSDLYKQYAAGLIDENGLSRGVEKIAGNMLNSANSFIPVAQQFMKAVDSGMSKVGISLTKDGDSSQTATANGVTSITFEQASNIIALTTAGNISRDQTKDILTSKLSAMDASMQGVQMLAVEQKSIADELRTIQANSYLELQGIHDDTSAMNKTLKILSSDVSDIKKNIKDM
ncbi:hypothetical protein ABVC73_05600 [Prevotella melaninogenica]